MTKDKFIDLTKILELEKKIKELQEKADRWDYEQYWSTGGRQNHGAG